MKFFNCRHFQSFDYSQTSAHTSAIPDTSTSAGLYPTIPQAYESSYIGSPPTVYGGQQFLNPNASSFPTSNVASTGTEFEDEPPLLEGILFISLILLSQKLLLFHRKNLFYSLIAFYRTWYQP